MEQSEKIEKLARELMKWHKQREYVHGPLMHGGSYKDLWYGSKGELEGKSSWNPYKSWSDAGRILDKLVEDEFGICITYSHRGWECELHSLTTCWSACGLTALEAICEAALKTLEVR